MRRSWILVSSVCVGLCVAIALNAVEHSTPVHAQAQAAPTELPVGQGKAIVERSCTVCHGVDTILTKRATPDEWKSTVDTMVSRGADLKDAEVPIVVKYLSDSFPVPPATPAAPATPETAAPAAAAPAQTAAPAPTELPDGPSKAVVQRSCTVCHGVDYILAKRATPDEWKDTVNTMVSRGADLSDAEVPVVIKYLSDSFPNPPAASAAPATP